jgi:hypothetical protein
MRTSALKLCKNQQGKKNRKVSVTGENTDDVDDNNLKCEEQRR